MAKKVQGAPIEIRACARVSFEHKKVWYTSEYSETRHIPEGADMETERSDLWNTVNSEVDKQVEEVFKD